MAPLAPVTAVIVPCFRCTDTIDRAVQSVVDQSFAPPKSYWSTIVVRTIHWRALGRIAAGSPHGLDQDHCPPRKTWDRLRSQPRMGCQQSTVELPFWTTTTPGTRSRSKFSMSICGGTRRSRCRRTSPCAWPPDKATRKVHPLCSKLYTSLHHPKCLIAIQPFRHPLGHVAAGHTFPVSGGATAHGRPPALAANRLHGLPIDKLRSLSPTPSRRATAIRAQFADAAHGRADLSNYRQLRLEGLISGPLAWVLYGYSVLKTIRRWLLHTFSRFRSTARSSVNARQKSRFPLSVMTTADC